ncbi:Esterase YdiI [Sporotomaculum syntrophicum]|uniref:Esterase YdiI n=1 Tax=Sporotomaculum syntrophicum TaxID=182264 RepID=A0A9D2WMY0_9FIRM|nr:PaaI family thioesterase [Sporotomaculum syntrophicum]KAF1084234.1 Esterase YdiI [Sporotomaculum syntrophicum]
MNLLESLNIEYFRLDPVNGEFEAKMNLTSFHSQPFGMLHGGATIAFGETVAAMASNCMIEKDKIAVGQTVVAYHFKPKKIEGYLLAKGILMHQGKRSHVWRIEMYDENELLISCVTVTNTVVKK